MGRTTASCADETDQQWKFSRHNFHPGATGLSGRPAGQPARQLVFRGDTNNHFVAVSCNYGVLSAVIQLVVPGNITREPYLVTFRTRVVQKAAKKHSSMDG